MSWNDLRKGRYSAQFGEYFITFTTVDRKRLFENHQLALCVCRSILSNEAATQSLWLAWVLMPDHFHGLLRIDGDIPLSRIVQDLKGRSACALRKASGCKGGSWQRAYYDRALRKEDDRLAIARYIVANPLRAGLCSSISDYPYWNSVYL